MRNPEALIFDMDGVLIDSEPLHKQAKQIAFAEAGLLVPMEVYEEFKGRPDHTIVTEVVARYGNGQLSAIEVLERKHRAFEEIEGDLALIPGVVEFLEWASDEGYRLALATSATPRNQETAFERFGLTRFFDVVVRAGDYAVPKPDPAVFLAALQRLGSSADRSWIVEDSLNGVIAGKGAGCFVAAITSSFSRNELKDAGADFVFDHFAELRERLAKLRSSPNTISKSPESRSEGI